MSYWIDLGKAEIDRALSRYAKLRGQSITESLAEANFPKNVIIMVGDGMSMATVAGARILKGQKLFNVSGEEQYLTWERFPESAFLKVGLFCPNPICVSLGTYSKYTACFS